MPSLHVNSNHPQGQSCVAQRVFFLVNPDQATPDPEHLELDVVVVNPDELSSFIRFVYLHAIVLIVIACLTWSAVILTSFDIDEFAPLPLYAWALIMFTLLMMFIYIPQLRYFYSINVIITRCCFFFSIMAGIYLVEYIDFAGLIIGILLSGLLPLGLYSYVALCSQVYLLKIPRTCIVTCLTILGITFIVLLFIENFILDVTYLVLCFVLNIVGALFQAQYLHGHFDIVPPFDTDAAFLVIYFQFATFLFSLEYIYLKVR